MKGKDGKQVQNIPVNHVLKHENKYPSAMQICINSLEESIFDLFNPNIADWFIRVESLSSLFPNLTVL